DGVWTWRRRLGETARGGQIFCKIAKKVSAGLASTLEAGAEMYPGMRFILLILSMVGAVSACAANEVFEYDVVVYGGTSAAITTAVQTKRMGKTVAVVSPDIHLGGLSSGGLGFSDTGDKAVIGGLSREFYHRVWKHYH